VRILQPNVNARHGYRYVHLASRFGVSKTMIRHIVHGRAWVGI
jgi:hypothetical protein